MGNTRRYIAFKRALLRERGAYCEACAVPATHPHHIIPVSETSIHSELVFDPANVMILCDECHSLMHPNFRRYPWLILRIGRSRALTQ